MIDTHCHLDLPAFDDDREVVWQRARAAGVRAAVIPGVAPAAWDRTASLARPGERFVALGIHPVALPDLDDDTVCRGLTDLPTAARRAGAVALGECGLDGRVDPVRAPLARQRAVLAAHVAVARTLDLPLILHVVGAHGEALALLRSLPLRQPAGVVHSYSGSAELLRDYLALGFFVSFAGAVTRPNARRPVAAARAAPLDRLLLETDAPDQPPTGAPPSGPTGRRCEPAHLGVTLQHLARLRGEHPDDTAEVTTRNARALFRLELE